MRERWIHQKLHGDGRCFHNPCCTRSIKPHFPFCNITPVVQLWSFENLDMKKNWARLKQAGQQSPSLCLPFQIVASCHLSSMFQGAPEEPTIIRWLGNRCQWDQKSKQTGYSVFSGSEGRSRDSWSQTRVGETSRLGCKMWGGLKKKALGVWCAPQCPSSHHMKYAQRAVRKGWWTQLGNEDK